MVINLDDEKYWRYAGTCRHCGFKNQFVVDKSAMSYIRFYKVVMEAYYPQWISFCDGCDNQAVYDLTAIAREN